MPLKLLMVLMVFMRPELSLSKHKAPSALYLYPQIYSCRYFRVEKTHKYKMVYSILYIYMIFIMPNIHIFILFAEIYHITNRRSVAASRICLYFRSDDSARRPSSVVSQLESSVDWSFWTGYMTYSVHMGNPYHISINILYNMCICNIWYTVLYI